MSKSEKHAKTAQKNGARKRSVEKFPIVGIGASAGGLEAIKELLQLLPVDTGMAFILVQHLDRTHESLGPEILARTTRMPVREIKNGMRVEPNHVYLIPPNFGLELLHNKLSLVPLRTGARGQPLVIDLFFQSLALERKQNAIGVILSGTGSDGTRGLKAIKAGGGLAMAQDLKSAKYGSMPESAIKAGFVDLILGPKGIAQELARISKIPKVATAHTIKDSSMNTDADLNDDEESKEGIGPGSGETLRAIFGLLLAHTQVDFSNYKHSTVIRRLQRRMMVRKCENIDTYFEYLKENPTEVRALFSELLIHVTEFFRDPESFKALEVSVFPQLVKDRKPGKPIRIWVPGCSTGEEAYSIAILLLEFLQQARAKIPIQIFATCIGDEAIKTARAGIYSQNIESAVGKERLKHFFEKVEGGYKIDKAVRDLCLFSKHDVTNDPPFSKLDLVSCRNVLIYFSAVLQKRVMPMFHYALNPDGFLFLGKSESIGGLTKLFTVVDNVHKIFSKVNIPTPIVLRAPQIYDLDVKVKSDKTSEQVMGQSSFQRDTEKVATKYAPPSVTVNADMEILQYLGRTAPCIEPSSGLASNNLFKMARQELVRGLRTTTESAKKNNASARLEGLSFQVDGKYRTFNIEVVPINPSAPARQRNYVIFFVEVAYAPISKQAGGSRVGKKGLGKSIRDKEAQRIAQLEMELAASKESYRTMSEEFDAAQEELTSANEEMQSTNEELQSTNEELETSKEELQSFNEELTTVNDELQSRNLDLVTLSSDLNNVLNNVDVPVVIIGNDRRIRRFTPKAEKIFNLISSDVGRPLSDIKPNFEFDLESMVTKAIKSLSPQNGEIQLDTNAWVRLQVQPYRTIDDRIDGAVITLVDITALKERLAESQMTLKNATSIADTLRLPLVVLDEQLRILSANVGFAKIFDVVPHKDIGSDLLNVLGGKGWSIPRLRELLRDVMTKNQELIDFKVEHEFPELGHRIFLLNARRIDWQGTMPEALLLSIDDVTERRTLEIALEYSEQRFRKVVESAHDGIMIVNSKGIIEFANQRTLTHFGYEPGELDGKPFETLIPERHRAKHSGYHTDYMANPHPRPMGANLELFGRRKDGSEIPIDISLSPIKTGPETKVTAIIRDISETKKLAIERKALLEQERDARASADQAKIDAELANATKDVFLATLSHELRTPLSSILSWAQLIQKNKFDPDKLKHGIQTIEQSAKTQGQLIDDLLDVARIQSGKLSTHFDEIDPCDSVRLAIAAIRPIAEKKNIVVEKVMKLKPVTVWGDPERLQQVVWNLLTNAIKFSAVGGSIRVLVDSVEDDGKKYVSIKVIDYGKGIKPDFLPKLFERFSQADSSSVRLHGGLGLGLALVRDLTRLQGGTVHADSEGLGKGSTFTVLLPIKSEVEEGKMRAPKREQSEVINEQPNLAGMCVMIVEDDPCTMEALSETLTSFGAKTVSCATVHVALDSFAKEKPDVLVSDIAMPGEDGYSLIRKIRELGPKRNGGIPALALTAYATKKDVERALSAGFNSHMAKPFDTYRLGHELAKLAKKKL